MNESILILRPYHKSGTVPNTFAFILFKPHNSSWEVSGHYVHSTTDGETEAQAGWEIHPMSLGPFVGAPSPCHCFQRPHPFSLTLYPTAGGVALGCMKHRLRSPWGVVRWRLPSGQFSLRSEGGSASPVPSPTSGCSAHSQLQYPSLAP